MRELKFKLFKREQEKGEDPYGLLQTINVTDVKGYLQKEFDRAKEREGVIEDQHQKIIELEEIKIKYEAMLVVQEKTQERIERQDELIKKLRAEAEKQKDVERKLRAKIVDVKANAEKKIKELKSGAKKKAKVEEEE